MKVLNGDSGVLNLDLLTKEEMNSAPLPYYDKLIYVNILMVIPYQ